LFDLENYAYEVSLHASKFLKDYSIEAEDWIGEVEVFETILEELSPVASHGGEFEPRSYDWTAHHEAISRLMQIAGAALAAAHELEKVHDQLQLDREGE